MNLMPMGTGEFYLYLHNEIRSATKTKVDDIIYVSLTFDYEYNNGSQHPMPDWFKKELEAHLQASQNWEILPPSRQKEVLRYFSRLQSEEAKQRNLEGVMHVLSGEDGHFMGRDWTKGR